VDPVPDPLLLRKSGIAGNRTRASGSVARNSGHQTIEAVKILYIKRQYKLQLLLKAIKAGTETVVSGNTFFVCSEFGHVLTPFIASSLLLKRCDLKQLRYLNRW
jgi:hypothetical protein